MIKKLLLLGGIWGGLAWGQSPPFNLQISQQPLPPVVNMFANYTGAVGQTTNFYWVVARYGVGNSALSSPTQVNGIASTGSVAIGWNAPANPSGYTLAYDVLRTSSATFPVNGTCVSCLVSSATTSLTATDSLGALSNYNLATYNPQPSPITLTLDNVNASQVLLKGIVNGTNIFPLSSVIGSNGQLFYNNNGVYSATSGLTTDGNTATAISTVNETNAITRALFGQNSVSNTLAPTATGQYAGQFSLTIPGSNTQNFTGAASAAAGVIGLRNTIAVISPASGTITAMAGYQTNLNLQNGSSIVVTNGYGFLISALVKGASTTLTGFAGLAMPALPATNNTGVLIGSLTIPTGNFGINDQSGFPSKFSVTTVGALPTCNAGMEGAIIGVSDANATFTAGIGAIVAAGGTNHVPVYCDGTNWRIG